MRALEASHEKRFFGSKVTVSVHEGVGKTVHRHHYTAVHCCRLFSTGIGSSSLDVTGCYF